MNKRALLIATTQRSLWNFRRPLIKALQDSGFTVFCKSLADEVIDEAILNDLNIRTYVNQSGYYDLVIPYGSKPVLRSLVWKKYGGKYVFYITGLGKSYYIYLLLICILGLAKQSTIWVQNEEDYELFYGYSRDITIIPGSGIKMNENMVKKYNLSGAINLLYIGRIMNSKGIWRILEISRRFKITLSIFGKTNKSTLSFRLNKNKDWVRSYKGYTNDWRLEYQKILSSGNRPVFIYLSRYNEGIPRAVLEAMSCGIPCILSNGRGTKELIIDDNTVLDNSISRRDFLPRCRNILEYIDKNYLKLSEDSHRLVSLKYEQNLVYKVYKNQL